jgi:hypothetical protein
MTELNGNTIATFTAAVLVSMAADGVLAQERSAANRAEPATAEQRRQSQPVSLADWDYREVYAGWFADGVVDRPLYGPHGDEIGNVKNLLMNPRGQIVALVAEVGGFWDIGDTHVTIPWSGIERRAGKTYSPITEETAENYGMFSEEYFTAEDVGHFEGLDESFATGPYIWKATALLDDYVVLEDGEPFGYVTDLVFDQSGRLLAVVAADAHSPIDRRGVYAFPWDRRGWRPGFDHYTVRHTEEEIARLPRIDYSNFSHSAQ